MLSNENSVSIGNHLCDWFMDNMRDLPWRHTQNPYAIWISEVMLQQTRVETVIAYYNRFMSVFPTVTALADATIDEVNHLWQGLGYYRRAMMLYKGAQFIRDKCGGVFPNTVDELMLVPGIGPYTAGAIASFAFGLEVPAVDGNVLRVLSRIYGISGNIDLLVTRKCIEKLAYSMIPHGRVWSLNQALMELGALVCIPGTPRCLLCPVADACVAHKHGVAEELPVKKARKKPKVVERTVYIVTDGENALLHKRPNDGMLAGLWEFPGWPDEDSPLGLDPDDLPCEIVSQQEVLQAQHVFTHRIWDMRGVSVFVTDMNARQLDDGFLWIAIESLSQYAFPSAMRAFIEFLQNSMNN